MGKGSSQPTKQEVTQTNLPEYARPYFERLLNRAEAESRTDYVPYTGDRLAGFAGETEAGQQLLKDIAERGLPGIGEASDVVRGATDVYGRVTGYEGDGVTGYTMPDVFTADVAKQYMSPYQDLVTERLKEKARLDFRRSQAARDADAVKAGAFGGSRQAVQQYLAEEGLEDRLADIEAQGAQDAFLQAQKQFEADRSATMRGQEARLQTERTAQELDMAAKKLGMTAADAMRLSADQLVELEQRARAGDVESAKLLDAVGKQKQSMEQQQLDLAYQDFVRQRDYDREQLNFLSSILRGVPVSPSTEQMTMEQTNPYQELLGTGITGLSLYKALS